ncbi:Tll0287-like domain-containing protein [Cyclobacterium jeungdonense]|uniref:DUF3365 domain-containing protein n=1 Tax=Cyclobacterium jeungdonense TaxID=708087 RepID=A0ABT8CC56_9BACT|nr:DUF3365 domain-containing protein [Cyclobacterium jeungdonense]MDN3689767.1 DUF3365 domain-containing protein [Cyclobacterium jeungdonense]
MNSIQTFLSIGAVSFFLISCGNNKKIDRDIVEQVNQANEVKKVAESEIIAHAMKWGDEISQDAQATLIGALQKAIEERGVPGAIDFCQVEALPITDKVAEKHKVEIRRVSVKNRNPENQPNELEKTLLDAYQYNVENDINSRSNIQKAEDGEVLLFTKAITIPGGLCLNCHGEPGKDISEATLEKINSLYPNDKAINFKVGDLRGMWSISIPKKEVVKNM